MRDAERLHVDLVGARRPGQQKPVQLLPVPMLHARDGLQFARELLEEREVRVQPGAECIIAERRSVELGLQPTQPLGRRCRSKLSGTAACAHAARRSGA